MILQRLVDLADRVTGELPPAMYSPLRFKWQVELDEEGRCQGITPLSDGSAKNLGLPLISPNRKRSGTSPPPLLLGDKANYVLGFGVEIPAASWHFGQFRELVKRCAEETGEPTVQAVQGFLADHCQSPVDCPEEMQPGDLVCFRVGEQRPVDLPSVRRFWVAENSADGGDRGECLVCGSTGPVDRVSPVAIKGLTRIGGQSSGMALVSANKDAFLSYGAEQALIAPTCRRCGEAYANAINYMIREEAHHLFVGPIAFLFWASEEGGFSPTTLLSQPQEEDVKQLIESYRRGSAAGAVDPSAFYAVSLSASASRVVVRDWLDTTVPTAQANLGRWFELQRLVSPDGTPGRPLGVYALAASLYLKPNDQMVANVPRTLVRCALKGGLLPDWLLAQAVGRNVAETAVTRNRAALIKAVLLSQTDTRKEGFMEKLDITCTSPGYLCGRLLAELEYAQLKAVNPKATLVDRYYGAASSSPAIVFGNLLRNLQAHMAKLRRDKPGLYHVVDRRIQEVLVNLTEFPKTLNLKEQALFSLGYYHQKAANRSHADDSHQNTPEEGK